jgi:uncharacterized membrane protein
MKRGMVVGVAGVAWAGVITEAAGLLPEPLANIGRLAAVLATAATFWLMLSAHTRPIARAYQLGYEMGRRDQMKAVNTPRESAAAVHVLFGGAEAAEG